MSSRTKNREVAYTRAIQICQNLIRLAVYELIGGQILLPKEEGAHLQQGWTFHEKYSEPK